MSLAKRLDAIEAALTPTDAGEPCDTCGAPTRADRREVVHLFIGDELGTCGACGRHLDMKNGGRPVLAGQVIHLIRGTPPERPSPPGRANPGMVTVGGCPG
ncbi:MAG: hypothetical protein AB8F26_05480 [Phycisphaerales bacterium]